MEDCGWNGCVWGRGHEGRHQVRCPCRVPQGQIWVFDPKCPSCGGHGLRTIGAPPPITGIRAPGLTHGPEGKIGPK